MYFMSKAYLMISLPVLPCFLPVGIARPFKAIRHLSGLSYTSVQTKLFISSHVKAVVIGPTEFSISWLI